MVQQQTILNVADNTGVAAVNPAAPHVNTDKPIIPPIYPTPTPTLLIASE